MVKFLRVLKRAGSEFIEDDCLSSGAAMAYYAIFSLPPLMVVVFTVATWAGVSPSRINSAALQHLGVPNVATPSGAFEGKPSDDSQAASEESASSIQLESVAARAGATSFGGIGPLGRVLGVVVLIFASTGLFAQLQLSLNRAWEVTPTTNQGGIRRYLIKRVVSLGMILVVAVLLLGSVVASAVLARTIHFVSGAAPDDVIRLASFALDHALTFALATLMFAMVFNFLPDATTRWRDAWVGALFTSTLFVVDKALIAWYMQRADLGASWGAAAGSIIALLSWLYYTSLIVLFGAEVTHVWSKDHRRRPAEAA